MRLGHILVQEAGERFLKRGVFVFERQGPYDNFSPRVALALIILELRFFPVELRPDLGFPFFQLGDFLRRRF